jgi:L-alanine-DL-glutamate epimerase-like enolase superfamily enzyme
VNRALGGIETAIRDLYGKIRRQPVCELLGGEVKPVRIYGSSMSRTIKPEEEVERFTRLRDEKGITAFKFRELYTPELEIRDGALDLPGNPGWGVEFSKEWLEGSTCQVSQIDG